MPDNGSGNGSGNGLRSASRNGPGSASRSASRNGSPNGSNNAVRRRPSATSGTAASLARRVASRADAALAALAVLAGFAVYLATIAPTLTWHNGGDDGAELSAAAYVWGVAHPPGYPLYLIFVRLAEYLPWGDVIHRAAVFSACAAALAVAAVYACVLLLTAPPPVSRPAASDPSPSDPSPSDPSPSDPSPSDPSASEPFPSDATASGPSTSRPSAPGPLVSRRSAADRITSAPPPSVPSPSQTLGAHLPRRAGALFAALSFAFGPLLWSQAVIAEVYAFGALLLALFLLAFVAFLRSPDRLRGGAVGVTLALLISHQPTFAVLCLPLAWIIWRRRVSWRVAFIAAAGLLLVPLLFGTLWLRALAHPSMNWGEVDTFGNWVAHITARLYRVYFLAFPLPAYWPRIPFAAALIARQGGWLALAAAALGAGWLWTERRPFALLAASMAGFFVVFAVLYTARDGEIYILPTVQLCAIAAGVGVCWVLREVRSAWRIVAAGAMVASIGWQIASAWPAVDVSGDHAARTWGETFLAGLAPNAVVRSHTDEQTFVLWYLQHVEARRPDVAIVEDRLLPYAWYRQQLLRQYPQLAGQGIADQPSRSAAPLPVVTLPDPTP